MLTFTENFSQHLMFIVFAIAIIGLCCLILISSWFLGERSFSIDKNIPFESGINSTGCARLRFSFKFYLVAMCFVIFEVEGLYLFAWSISIRETGWNGFIEGAIFIIILLISLIYLIRIKIMEWMPIHSHRDNTN